MRMSGRGWKGKMAGEGGDREERMAILKVRVKFSNLRCVMFAVQRTKFCELCHKRSYFVMLLPVMRHFCLWFSIYRGIFETCATALSDCIL